jgi:class 3 adenylate cyclase
MGLSYHPAAQTPELPSMQPIAFEARDTFRATPEQLWPLIADTPRLNQAAGLPPVEYTITPTAGEPHVEARARILGVTVARWTEHPFRWEAPRGLGVLRELHGGPVRRFRAAVELTPVAAGTEVHVRLEVEPRNALGALLIRRVGPASVAGMLALCRGFEAYLAGQQASPYPQLLPKRPSVAPPAGGLDRPDIDQRVVELLRRHLAEAPDHEVVKMRPFELADRWGLDRRGTLAAFLHATTAGLLTMSWDVLCPNCRVGQAEYSSLRDLTAEAHCEICNITFGAQFDRLVEVRFSAAPAVRRVESREFCIGGPMNTPHVLAQTTLGPGEADRLTCRLEPGRYRLRASGIGSPVVLDAGPGERPTELHSSVFDDRIQASTDQPVAGALTLAIVNRGQHTRRVVLERDTWPDTIATAALVSTMQEFRDLFSSEALAPGLLLGIERLAFLFTDLAGSTALYEALGQARAFRLVQDHFRVLGLAISANRGALVKTVGDAVMATFPTGADALSAALQMQRDLRRMPAPPEVDTRRLIRIGVHEGPCLAVTLNDRLDYFGTTVNTAARVEARAEGGEIVASLAACQSDRAAEMLRDSGASLREDVLSLKGLKAPLAVYRVALSPDR